MNITDAEKFALEKLQEHKLTEEGWSFVWDKSKLRFGQCRYRVNEIGISYFLALDNSEEKVKETILHEIAHALTPGHHHDEVWKAKCIELGIAPNRCYSRDEVSIQYELTASCNCEGLLHKRIKRPARHLSFYCRTCRKKLQWGKPEKPSTAEQVQSFLDAFKNF